MEKVGLQERLKHKSSQLSGGERQRVAICRALINEADLIIADEPTGSLDEKSAQEIEDLLFELVEEQKRTLLMVTHNEKLAKRCSKVYVLQNRGLTAIKCKTSFGYLKFSFSLKNIVVINISA